MCSSTISNGLSTSSASGRLRDLAAWIDDEFGVSLVETTVGRTLYAMGYRKLSAYIFGAICPARGVGAGLVLPRCNTDAMNLHLTEISVAVATDTHAILMVDQAGWHLAKDLKTPDNITMLHLPSAALIGQAPAHTPPPNI